MYLKPYNTEHEFRKPKGGKVAIKFARLHRTKDGPDHKKRTYQSGRKAYNGLKAHFRNWPNGKAYIVGDLHCYVSLADVEDQKFFIMDDE